MFVLQVGVPDALYIAFEAHKSGAVFEKYEGEEKAVLKASTEIMEPFVDQLLALAPRGYVFHALNHYAADSPTCQACDKRTSCERIVNDIKLKGASPLEYPPACADQTKNEGDHETR
jgi:hypothetical protein